MAETPKTKNQFIGGPEWIARIPNATIEQFTEHLQLDFSEGVGQPGLKRQQYKFSPGKVTYHWMAENELAVSLGIGHYTADSVTVVLHRHTPFRALMRPRELTLEEWVAEGQPSGFSCCTGDGKGCLSPWTKADEMAVIHGRALTDKLLAWLVQRFGAQFTSTPLPKILESWEDVELVSPTSLAYRTREGRKFWEERKRKNVTSPQQVKEELPTPEAKTRKNRGGRKSVQAHRNALQRLLDGQPKEQNRYQWKQEYQEETGLDPEHTESGADELYRAGVWKKYRKVKPDG